MCDAPAELEASASAAVPSRGDDISKGNMSGHMLLCYCPPTHAPTVPHLVTQQVVCEVSALTQSTPGVALCWGMCGIGEHGWCA